MKNFVVRPWFFILLFFLNCQNKRPEVEPETTQNASVEARRKILSLIHVEVFSDHIKLPDGRVFNQIAWDSDIQKQLFWALGNRERAKLVYDAYKKLYQILEAKGLYTLFGWWLVDHAAYLGSRHLDDWTYLNSQEIGTKIKSDPNLVKAVADFFQEIAIRQVRENHKFNHKIAILTTTGGGGHYSAAMALKAYLEAKGDNVVLIDELIMQKKFDPLWLVTGEWTSDLVYEKIFQQQTNAELAQKYWQAWGTLREYLPWQSNEIRKAFIKKESPDLLISTVHFQPDAAEIANELEIPMIFLATDYVIPQEMMKPSLIFQQPILQYWLPTSQKILFLNFSNETVNASLKAFRQKWASSPQLQLIDKYTSDQITKKEFFQKFSTLREVGFPVRDSFVKASNADEVSTIKAALKIRAQSQLAIISMGKAGVGTLKEIVEKLISEKDKLRTPLTAVAICGQNDGIRDELIAMVKTADLHHSKLNLIIEGFVDERKIADYFKVANVLISKAGGATTAETTAMHLPILIYHEEKHLWEEGNVKYLEDSGLGIIYDPTKSLVAQIDTIIAKNIKMQDGIVDWKKQISLGISETLQKFYQ